MRTRVLFVNEFSCHNSGYAKYGMEVLKRLSQKPDIQIAELACYASASSKKDARLASQLPWDVYFNVPDVKNKELMNLYSSKKSYEFGEFQFNDACINFKPHIVMDIRDWWMQQFQEVSPFRKRYNWAIMTTVDATPQNRQWIQTFCNADGVFTYTDWGKQVLKEHAGENINLLGTASPCAEEWYKPCKSSDAKQAIGMNTDIKVIGTVMRNQGRKLFPDLFSAFKKFLEKSGRTNVFLYCHTAYPDSGWDIPELLKKYEIVSRVLFTYKCSDCNFFFPSFFNGVGIVCPKCGNVSAKLPRVESGVSDEELVKIIQTFDLYVQYANSEGFGMPLVEAASTGIPVVGIDYSAMTDVLSKLEGDKLSPLHLATEVHSGRLRAIPDNEAFSEYLIDFFSLPLPNRAIKGKKVYENAKAEYNWDETAEKWYEYFKTVDVNKYEELWSQPAMLRKPAPLTPDKMQLSTNDYCKWLINEVLCDSSKLYGFMHMRLIRDITNGIILTDGEVTNYANESSVGDRKAQIMDFNREHAYNYMRNLANEFNAWETKRGSR